MVRFVVRLSRTMKKIINRVNIAKPLKTSPMTSDPIASPVLVMRFAPVNQFQAGTRTWKGRLRGASFVRVTLAPLPER